jgi:Rrf2 family transcriptional regulator, iron-sulfur cluster assembly transcription factor
MQITRSDEYALKGLIFLASLPPERLALVSDISRAQRIPESYLAKIFQRLSKVGLLKSARGLNGGFSLGRPAGAITMRDVIEALDGPIALNRCLVRKGECEEESRCSLHEVLEEAQERFLEVLTRTTMEDLARQTVHHGNMGRR